MSQDGSGFNRNRHFFRRKYFKIKTSVPRIQSRNPSKGSFQDKSDFSSTASGDHGHVPDEGSAVAAGRRAKVEDARAEGDGCHAQAARSGHSSNPRGSCILYTLRTFFKP
jgi:hypothetical protein